MDIDWQVTYGFYLSTADEAKRKKAELIRKRIEENTSKKPKPAPVKTKDDADIFDMNLDDEPKNNLFQKQASIDVTDKDDFDFTKKVDRKARMPNNAAMAARDKLEKIKAKMRGGNVSDRMAEIDKECEEDEKRPKSEKSEKDRDRHKSSHKDKHRDKDRHSKHKHKHKHKHSEKDKERNSSKQSHSKPSYTSTKPADSDSDSDISDISLEAYPKPKQQSWVSVAKPKPVVTEKPKPKIRPKSAAPPPPSFQELMAMAQKKADAPEEVQKTLKKELKKKTERPMTQEEKERHERINSKEYKQWLQTGKRPIKPTVDRTSLAPHPTKPNTAAQPKQSSSSSHEIDRTSLAPHPTKPNTAAQSRDNHLSNGRSSVADKSSKTAKNGMSGSISGSRSNHDSYYKSAQRNNSHKNGKSEKREQRLTPAEEHAKKLRELQEEIRMKQKQAEDLMKQFTANEQKPSDSKHSKSASSSSRPQGYSSSSSSRQPQSYSSSSSSSRPQGYSSSSSGIQSYNTSSSSKSSTNGNAHKRTKHAMSDEEEAVPTKKSRVVQEQSTNPWDRIYSQIRERNPKRK